MTLEAIEPRPGTADYPPGTMQIGKIWIYICRDANGDEGVCAATMPNGLFSPLIAADQARLKALTPIAERLAARLGEGQQIILVEFTTRTDLRNITGAAS